MKREDDKSGMGGVDGTAVGIRKERDRVLGISGAFLGFGWIAHYFMGVA